MEHFWGDGIDWTGPSADGSVYPMSEDCLYFHIIRLLYVANATGLSVAAWIHGGRLNQGDGSVIPMPPKKLSTEASRSLESLSVIACLYGDG
ncbi:uncharacterized protein BJX67DRAFT_365214 [Aspergillus lucknowensis]|uniref:Uncharacterized protein n=1 Tax=Aspergillus lucknowensis TaxID=176173 RepID=A0ABR4LFQ4_9EURO